MPEPRAVLLPDFGVEDGPVGLAPVDAFVPLSGKAIDPPGVAPVAFAAHGEPFTSLAGAGEPLDAPIDAVVRDQEPHPPHPPQPNAPGGAAALQTMLNDAFAGDGADTQPAQAEINGSDGEVPQPAQDLGARAALDAQQQEHHALVTQLHAQIDAMQTAHDAELARITAQSTAAVAEVAADAVMDGMVAILANPLFEATADVAITQFRDALIALLRKAEVMTVQVKGPCDRLERLRAHWPEGTSLPELVEAEGLELVAMVDRSVLSTRLEDLRAILLEDHP